MPSSSKADRQAAEERGRAAERVAALWLMCKGYRVLERRYKTPGGEADLVLLKRGTLIFCEVKGRASLEAGLNAIPPAQRARIIMAARFYLSRHPKRAELDIRFDALVVSGFRLWHVADAWRPEN